MAKLAKPLPQGVEVRGDRLDEASMRNPDREPSPPPRLCRERRGEEAEGPRDESPPFHHWITSSARASTAGGMVNAQRLRGLQVHHELELGGLLDRQIGGVCTLEGFVGEAGGAAIHVGA